MSAHYEAAACTDRGPRPTNQDAVIVDATAGYAAVADGMGGAAGGEVASQETIAAVREILAGRRGRAKRDLAPLLEGVSQEANRRVGARAEADPELLGMGSTLALLVVSSGRYCAANVGDSRVYLLRDRVLSQLSHDHSRVQERVDAGIITEAEALRQPDLNIITRAIGTTVEVTPHLAEGEILPGDRFLLTSDGVHGVLGNADLSGGSDEERASATAKRLVGDALARGTTDNATAAVLRVSASGPDSCGQRRGWSAMFPWRAKY